MTAQKLLAELEERGLAVCRLTLTRPVDEGGRYLWFPVGPDELKELIGDERGDRQVAERADES